ncbi:hypothetical protein G9464_02945 [Halostella sp. JP-L12]|uniref:hypothetical protein n=1 Tax=Halostella TaxID=1843185 RepID=UPI0013CE6903|nr:MULTISPECIES: hypothetical protein [Halostella]NHN46555.1 hypothetical protein [Halostella sp. JP-L12]
MAGVHPDQERERQAGTESDPEGETPGDSFGAVRGGIQAVVAAWMAVVRAVSWLIARVVALLAFVIGFVPYSIVLRLVRFDPLDRDLDPEAESYWSETVATNRELDEFRKQY